MRIHNWICRASLIGFLTALVYMNCWLFARRAGAEPTYQECNAKYSGTCGTSNCNWIDIQYPAQNACEHYHQVAFTGCVTTTSHTSCSESWKGTGQSQVCETRRTYIGAFGDQLDCHVTGNCSGGDHINYFGNFFPECTSGPF